MINKELVENNGLLLELKDGGIVDIKTGNDYNDKFVRSDYTSIYIIALLIELTKKTIHIDLQEEDDCSFTIGNMMKMILPNVNDIQNMTENEFCNWFELKVKQHIYPSEHYKDKLIFTVKDK